jgi:adenosylmethionine-8-amino-7-oxononanoate aminotransferase
MNQLAELDQRYLWHPFTQMRDWLRQEPTVIVSGRGSVLRDVNGCEYLDANASIWTNLHGHNHPKINRAITAQLKKIAHSSALGLANEPASRLGAELVQLVQRSAKGDDALGKVFYSDDGSTAMEVSLKLAYEYARRTGLSSRPRFLSLAGAYHGDTVGAVSLGHIDLFHKAYGGLLFHSDSARAPYCYRCPNNHAKPERADARTYHECRWQCMEQLEEKFASQKRRSKPYAGFVFEPVMQGAAGLIAQPDGWLRRAAGIARSHGALLIADEIMTGLGRVTPADSPALFGSHLEGVQPDFISVAKGLSGGYLPLAATLTTQSVFDAFLGEYEEFKTFFHGHSFTGNQLGCAAARASLELLESPATRRARAQLEAALRAQLATLWDLPQVGDIRQTGTVVGIELVRQWRTRKPFDLSERAGIRVCEVMAKHGVLTRPVGNVIALIPPYCTTPAQVEKIIAALRKGIQSLKS